MSRLIDADALMEKITKYKFGAITNESEREYTREVMFCFVNGSPTAYDIEKVVAELEEASHWEEPTYDEDGYSNDDSWEVVYSDKAVEIVRKGGAT